MYSVLNNSWLALRKWVIAPASIFMISTMIVNGGNYLYNIILGKTVGPQAFADAGLMMTLLLVISFIGMTFQLVSAKFTVDLSDDDKAVFYRWINGRGFLLGVVVSLLLLLSSNVLTGFFNLSSQWLIIVFALSIPFYFLMSCKRGQQQGGHDFLKLSLSYQIETWSKIVLTFVLVMFFPSHVGLTIAIAILGSIVAANSNYKISPSLKVKLPAGVRKTILVFFAYTMGYELIQILINYGDLLMVKHYFDNVTAGLYTSMALIGRMIYFLTWMLVMVLIPTVLKRKKENLPYKPIMYQYFSAIALFAGTIVCFSFFFPKMTITLLFGEAFLSFAPFLWLYAVATALFALSNLFIYYFICLEKYLPVYVAAGVAILQFLSFFFFHERIEQIIVIQIIGMGCLLIMQMLFFTLANNHGRSEPIVAKE